ncbi:MAG: tripartite tricarboxylate transporter substrate binding protein [Burkholderiales bacterium]|nr:tripartite tricarboxylate transporter substrate binding protein [Burkholderiales bacterium]
MLHRKTVFICGTAAIALLCAAQAAAQTATAYPSRAVRIVIPYPPGGGNDIIGRIVADELGKRLGQQMVVDNRSGGSTAIGAENVARSAPDGYSLLITSHTTYALLPNLRPRLSYDPQRDFEPVSLLATQSFALAVHPSLPATTVKQIIALAKSRPGQMSFASAGAGTGTHFSGEQFKVLAGLDILHVPYKGGNPAITSVLSGETTMTFGSLSALSAFVTTKKLRVIAVTGAKRSPLDPKIPTIAESGLKDYEMTPWYGLTAPRGTSTAIVDRLNTAVVAVTQSREAQERMMKVGYEPEGSTPRQLAEHIKAELARYAKLIKAIGFKEE